MQPLFESCSDLLESHRYAECIHRLGELVRTAQTAEELILAARVADAALLRGLELRLVRRAARLAPADPDVILYQAGTYLERGRFLEAEELLLPYLEDADWAEDERSRAHGYLAISYAARRRFRSAARALEQATALAAAAGTDAEHLVEYIRLNIQAYQDQWEDSIKGLHALIEAGGDELRALMLMATCHECLGDADAVVRTLRQACERFPEYPALHLRLSSAAWAVGRTDLAHQALEKVAALLPGRSGDRIVRRCRDMLDEPGRRLHVPPVRQGHNNCFPACLDMLLAYYGRPADQRSIGAVVRDGNGGTPLFRALRYLEEQGWAVRTFRATPERVRQLIDRGVPPILGLEWAGGAHVHICAGYDDQWLYIQDPGSFQRRHLRLKGFDDVYAHSDYWALAVVPPESAGLLDILPAEDDAAIRRVQACWEHLSQDRRGEAAALLAEIDREERTVSSALLRLRVWPRLGTQEGALEAADWLLARFPDHRQIRLEVAQHLVRLDQEDRAVALVREHKGRQPSRALIILGDAARRESPEEACRLYRKAAIADPESELPLAHWGDAELQLGNLERAEALFEAAYEMDPSPGRAADLAHLLLRQGRPAEAVAAFRKVLREEPFFAWAWYMRAEAHWALGQHRVAARCFRIAMAQDRERAHPVDRLADLYSETGQPARAIALLRESPLLPTSADLQLSLAILLGGQGEWAEALAIAEPAMHRFPEDVRFGPFVAECLRLTGRQPEGRALLERLADEHPDEAYVQARFGRFLLLEGEAEKGVEHIDRALRLKPEWEDPLDWALGAARKAEQPEPALRYLTDKLVPAGHPARLAYLARLWADHDLAQARELALAAWEHEDIPAGALGDVADVLLRCDDARGALAALRQALRKDRVYAWAWWCRGHAHWALGQRRAAIRAMRIAVAQDPDAPAPLRQLAEWYEETGRPDRAVAVLRESPLTAGSADLQHDLALLLLRLGRHAEALDVARGALDQFGEAGRFGPVAADALAGLENRAEALALLTRLGEQAEAGGDFDCLRDLARAWAKYDRARAVHWGRKAVALVEPERRQLSCGLMLAEFGEHGEAETVLRRVVEELPSPKAFYALSQIAQEKGDHAARVDWLRRAVETAEGPDDALDYAGELGEALLEAGEPDAVTELMTGLAGRVNEAWRLTYLGWVAERAERYADAVAHYEAALQADPAYGWTHYRLPQALAALDRHEEALEAAVAGVSRFPADAAFQWLAGKCLAAVGRRDEAATHFRRALRLDPGSAAAAHGLWSAWARRARRRWRPSSAACRRPPAPACFAGPATGGGRTGIRTRPWPPGRPPPGSTHAPPGPACGSPRRRSSERMRRKPGGTPARRSSATPTRCSSPAACGRAPTPTAPPRPWPPWWSRSATTTAPGAPTCATCWARPTCWPGGRSRRWRRGRRPWRICPPSGGRSPAWCSTTMPGGNTGGWSSWWRLWMRGASCPRTCRGCCSGT